MGITANLVYMDGLPPQRVERRKAFLLVHYFGFFLFILQWKLKVREPFRFFRRTLVLRWWRSSSDAELLDGLVVEDGNYKVAKTRFSDFFATNLHSLLQRCGIKDLVIAGKLPIPQINPT